MARSYKRDARGRFSGGGGGSSGGGGGSKKAAGGGGAKARPKIGGNLDNPSAKPKAEPKAKGGGGSKAAATKAANKANTQRLMDKGQRSVGSRLKKSTERSYSGTKATKEKQARDWVDDGKGKGGAAFSNARQRGTMSKRRGK